MQSAMSNDVAAFQTHGEPEVELLAFSLDLRNMLKSGWKVTGFIPNTVYEKVDPSVFRELIFDTLSTVDSEIEKRLTLKVHNSDYFRIESDN
jgi:hypothetical protein